MLVVDEKLDIVMLNPTGSRMLGIEGASWINQPLTKLSAAVGFSIETQQWLTQTGSSGERHATVETAGVTVDLLFKSTEVKPGYITIGTKSFRAIAITDITQFLAGQRQVNGEYFRRHWQALTACVVISDACAPDMPIVFVNSMFEQITGYAASEVLGRNCRFLQGTDAHQSGLVAIRDAIDKQTNGHAKLRNYRKDGTPFDMELFISPMKDERGKVTHFVGIQHTEFLVPTANL